MRKVTPAANPDEYVKALVGWQRPLVETLREAVRKAAAFEEAVKWGHLVYSAKGPALLIRAEATRVLIGFWRGQRLRSIENRFKPGGKFEMASLDIREGTEVDLDAIRRLAQEAAVLNRKLGDPTGAVR
ncbi:MAG: DUF1801 domain-containing protein [Cucumibacter sp.]